MNAVLRVEGLKKSYGRIEALKGIDFEVREGEVFALIGPNGAGKTTTLRVVATLLTLSEGKVTFLGNDLKKNPEKFREGISYLPEEAGAYKNLKGMDKVGTYSKGMVRKLLLARALMTKPALVILDEPTSGLDVINSLEVREIIKKFAGEGIAVLLSSHNMLEIEFLSDRVALIDKGRILDHGTSAELKARYQAPNLEVVFRSALR
jgi:ABC-2 type transport system ATP-binding protein